MIDNIVIFKPEFYDRVKQRIIDLQGEVEEALKIIKSDDKLRELLGEYIRNNATPEYEEDDAVCVSYRPLDLYKREYKLPRFKKWEEGQVLKIRLSLQPTNDTPINFTYEQKELGWWGDTRWPRTNGDWAVYHGGPDTGAGWESRSQRYNVEERKVGFYLTPQDSKKIRARCNIRISSIEQLKEVTKRDIFSNLEKELERLSI